MTISTIVAGNVVKNTYLFVPESGTVSLANVTARLHKADRTETDLTVTTTGTNAFRADWQSAGTDITGLYIVRWKSATPSPVIADETYFKLVASSLTTP